MSKNKKSRRGKKRSSKRLGFAKHAFQILEPRRLLAGVHFDSTTGDMNVFGDGGNNVGQVDYIGATQVRATIDGQQYDFDTADVARVVFVGFGGDDQFSNNTAIPGLLFGHAGNDTIHGGSGDDVVNGGAGNDTLYGNGGNDEVRGAGDNDIAYGGDGNDRIFGDNGTNELHGEDGDDVIYGGVEADVITGGDGIDQMFGLAGDDVIDSGNGGIAGSAGIGQADLVLGLDGNDTITGGDGLNVFWGGNGVDTMTGGLAENRIHGQNGNDIITGNEYGDYLAGNNDEDTIYGMGGTDFIFGGEDSDLIYGGDGNDFIDTNTGNDVVFGEGGNDTMTGWIGNDDLTGGEGDDVATYTRDYANFSITGQVGNLVVHDDSGFAGTNFVKSVETLRFTDGDQAAVPNLNQVVQVQPIIVSNNNGSNTSEFMGGATEEANIKTMIDDIFAQAGVDVEWLSERTWNNSFANVGNGGERPNDDLDQIVEDGDAAGIGHTDTLILDMYFVEVVPAFNDVGESTANGLAFIGANGITAHVGDFLPTFQEGRDVVAQVLAHEIAHNLGLDHVADRDNLMANGTELTASQIQTILDSPYTQEV